MEKAAIKQIKKDYDLDESSCIDVCSDALEATGLDPGTKKEASGSGASESTSVPDIPRSLYKQIVKNNKGKDVTDKISPDAKVIKTKKTEQYKKEQKQKEKQRKETEQFIKDLDIKH
jgi:hypothetical protein